MPGCAQVSSTSDAARGCRSRTSFRLRCIGATVQVNKHTSKEKTLLCVVGVVAYIKYFIYFLIGGFMLATTPTTHHA